MKTLRENHDIPVLIAACEGGQASSFYILVDVVVLRVSFWISVSETHMNYIMIHDEVNIETFQRPWNVFELRFQNEISV